MKCVNKQIGSKGSTTLNYFLVRLIQLSGLGIWSGTTFVLEYKEIYNRNIYMPICTSKI